jgi:hypothetical protein
MGEPCRHGIYVVPLKREGDGICTRCGQRMKRKDRWVRDWTPRLLETF